MPSRRVVDDLLAAYDEAGLIPLFSERAGGLTVPAAYDIGDRLRLARLARGERALGYKIGFTNRTIWPRYQVFEPIWAPVWDHTVHLLDGTEATTRLHGLVQPRLEPEIVFGFRASPHAGMSESELTACLEWVAHGCEIVHTHFEGWRFTAADTVADFALHGRLFVGPRVPVGSFTRLGEELAALELTLACDGKVVDTGHGRNVLDGPLNALRLWVDAMTQRTPGWPLGAGDIVTTGTLTDAWPMAPGQVWQSRPSDPRLPGLRLSVTP